MRVLVSTVVLSLGVASAQETSSPSKVAPKSLAQPDFVLRDKDLKLQKGGLVAVSGIRSTVT
jgi:hypothetical protein